MLSKIKDLVKRNAPIFIIGGITLAIFVGIIISSQKRNNEQPALTVVDSKDLIAEHTFTKGNPKAQVTLVEFSDFECPACGAYFPVVNELVNNYPDDLRFAYRHFPLNQHPNARNAAKASQAAGQQEAFWEYHDFLFANQKALTEEDLLNYAQSLGLNMGDFKKDYASDKIAKQVQDDYDAGIRAGVSATPSFFLNGRLLNIRSPEELKQVVATQVERKIIELERTGERTQEGATRDTLTVDPYDGAGPTQPVAPGLKEDNGTLTEPLTIVYTEEKGFHPDTLDMVLGQKMIWRNDSDKTIILVEKIKLYPDFGANVLLPGESFEFTPTENRVWAIREKDTFQASFITPYVISNPEQY